MKIAIVFLAFILAGDAFPATAHARGETSYTLPERRVGTPAEAPTLAEPVWSRAMDAPGQTDVTAIGSGIVAFATDGRLCAHDDGGGAIVWCAARASSPAYAGGVVAYALPSGIVRGVDARTGATLWTLTGTAVWPSGNAFVIASKPVQDPQTNASYTRLSGVTAHGERLWSTTLSTGGVAALDPSSYLIWSWASAGATLSISSAVVGAAFAGGVLGIVGGDVVDVRPPLIFADTQFDTLEEVQDHALVFNLGVFDAKKGAYVERYDYAPDYDENYAALANNCCAGEGTNETIRVEGDDVYVVFHHRIYRYRLAPASLQHPLRVADDAVFLGGPYRGTIYVSRPNGVWSLHPERAAIRTQLVAPSSAAARKVTIADNEGFAIFDDGEVRGFDLSDGHPIFDAAPCRHATPTPRPVGVGVAPYTGVRVATTSKRIYVACSTGGFWSLYAFAKPYKT